MSKGFKATREQLHTAAVLAIAGTQQELIAQSILNPKTNRPISVATLRKHLLADIDKAIAQMNAKVHLSLYQMATGADVMHGPKVAAQRFWIMRQDMIQQRHEEQARIIEGQARIMGPQDRAKLLGIPDDLSSLTDDELDELCSRAIALDQDGME